MSQSELDRRIHQVRSEFEQLGPFSAGYPVNQDFDYSDLYPLLAFAANNVGDPFGYSRYQSNTCLLYTSPSPRDGLLSRMPSSA